MTEFEKRREGLSGAAGALRAPDPRAADPRAADLRAPGEDDDGYDPYSDYMDAWGRADDEEPCEDPWR